MFDVGFSVQKDRGSSIVNIQPSFCDHRPPKILYENTYRMEPENKPDLQEIRKVAEKTIHSFLEQTVYDAKRCRTMSNTISLAIREQVKLLVCKRYKVVCVVKIGENKSQGIRIASRCLWDDKKDNQVDVVYNNPSLFCVAAVYLVYCE